MTCENIINIDLYVAPGDAGIATTVNSGNAGNYRLLIEFNSTYQQLILTCEENAEIIIPNILNGEYAHMVRIFAPDGSLFNDTCYCLNTHTVTNSGSSVNPTPTIFTQSCSIQVTVKASPDPDAEFETCIGDMIPAENHEGNTLTIPYLDGLYIQLPIIINNTPNQTIPFTNSPFVLDNTANGGFLDGDIITINYAQPIQ